MLCYRSCVCVFVSFSLLTKFSRLSNKTKTQPKTPSDHDDNDHDNAQETPEEGGGEGEDWGGDGAI